VEAQYLGDVPYRQNCENVPRAIANPIGAIPSAAMLLRNSLDLEAEATAVEQAVTCVLESGDVDGRPGRQPLHQ
jgi:hypothetical protein